MISEKFVQKLFCYWRYNTKKYVYAWRVHYPNYCWLTLYRKPLELVKSKTDPIDDTWEIVGCSNDGKTFYRGRTLIPEGYVVNREGIRIPFETCVQQMDDMIREYVHRKLYPCTDQEFFDAYAKVYYSLLGERWIMEK